MIFSERIKQRREKMGINQDELAHISGISQAQISRYEKGDSQPTAAALIALSKSLNVSIDWLLGVAEPVGEDGLNAQEMEILRLFREKSSDRRLAALEIMKWA